MSIGDYLLLAAVAAGAVAALARLWRQRHRGDCHCGSGCAGCAARKCQSCHNPQAKN